jgi:hypothetical protein
MNSFMKVFKMVTVPYVHTLLYFSINDSLFLEQIGSLTDDDFTTESKKWVLTYR